MPTQHIQANDGATIDVTTTMASGLFTTQVVVQDGFQHTDTRSFTTSNAANILFAADGGTASGAASDTFDILIGVYNTTLVAGGGTNLFIALGSGNTAWLSRTQQDTVILGADALFHGSRDTIFGSNANIDALSNAAFALSGRGNNLHGGQNINGWIFGSGNSAAVGDNAILIDSGHGDGTTAGGYSNITLNGTNNYAHIASHGTGIVNGSGNGLVLDDAATLTLGGTNNSASAGTGSFITVTGNLDGIVTGDASTVTITGQSDAALLGQSASLHLTTAAAATSVASSGNGQTVLDEGLYDTITVGDTAHVTITGSRDRVIAGSAATLDLAGLGNAARAAAASTAFVHGTADTVTLAANANVTEAGTNDSIGVTDGTGSRVGIIGGTGAVVSMDNGLLLTQPGTTGTLVGTGNTATFDTNTNFTVFGDGNYLNVLGGSSLAALGGGNAIYASAGSHIGVAQTNGRYDVIFGSGISGGLVAGNQQAGIFVDAGAQANLSGSSDVVSLGQGSTLGLLAGSGGARPGFCPTARPTPCLAALPRSTPRTGWPPPSRAAACT